MTPRTASTGQILAATLRSTFGIGTRTGRYGKIFGHRVDLHAEMIEAIENAVQYPGYYSTEKTETLHAAWGAALSYRKHYDGSRIDGVLRAQISQMSAYQFAALLGRMVDANVMTTGAGEQFFADMAREMRAAV
jgi:hypothetical protein